MLVPMKKLPIDGLEVTVQGGRKYCFVGPKKKLRPLLTVLTAFDFQTVQETDSVPWREALKEDLEKHGETALMLRGARLKAGLSQTALARKLGTAQGNISQMEQGLRPIGKKMAHRLSKILNVNYRVFL